MKVSITSFASLVVAALLLIFPQALFNPALAAGEDSISGVVTSSTGTPVRGAIVKVAMGTKSFARYTDKDGRYRITGVEPGHHEMTVDAFGYALAKQTIDLSSGKSTNIKLSPQMDLSRLTSAEMRFLFPETKEMRAVYDSCSLCHGLVTPLARSGMPQVAWAGFLPHMTEHRWGTDAGFPVERVVSLAPLVDKVYGLDGFLGPNAHPDFSKIKHTPLADGALSATITEYVIPVPDALAHTVPGPMAHTINVDDRSGIVWFSNYDAASNEMVRFDPETETFQQFPIPLPRARAHTGDVLKDGRYIIALNREDAAIKLAMTDSNGKVETFDWPAKSRGPRVVKKDPARENIVWAAAGNETWQLNIKTKKFRAYKNLELGTFPEGSYAADFLLPAVTSMSAYNGNSYDLAVDSKGFPWLTQLELGHIFRLDPETGEMKGYHTPEMVSTRGIDVDAQDNIWFGDYFGHQIGMLDPKTGNVKLYKTPNPYASPYGVMVDRRRGHVWYADLTANNISRLDPKTGKFIEYALPTKNVSVRFMAVDPKGRAWYGGFWSSTLGVIDPGEG